MEITWNGTVTRGILQGSILGLILFVKFINDLLECILSEVLCFTNDTKLFSDIRTEDDVETTWLEQPLWLECWIDVTIPPRQT